MVICSGLPYLLKGEMLAFNIGQSYLEQPADVVVLLANWSWYFDQGGGGSQWNWGERELSCELGTEAFLESGCCGMNCLVISSGTELPRWHVHPAASNTNEQIFLRLNEMFQRVIKAAFWESENKVSSSLCKKKVQIVNVCTRSLSPLPHSVFVDLEVFKGLGRRLWGSQCWTGLEFVHWNLFVNLTPQAYPIAWQGKYGSLEKISGS